MPIPLIAGMPPGLHLVGGYTIRLTALDPVTGATVTAVKISATTLQLRNLAGTAASALEAGPFLLVPGPAA